MNKKKNTGQFGVPPGYFESFEERLELRILEESLPDKPGFTIPDGYFEALEQELISRVSRPTSGKLVTLRRAVWWTAAAVAALLLLVAYPWETSQPQDLSDIDANVIRQYIDSGGIDLSTNDITALLNENEIELLSSEFDFLDQELLEEYLEDEIEYNTIITE